MSLCIYCQLWELIIGKETSNSSYCWCFENAMFLSKIMSCTNSDFKTGSTIAIQLMDEIFNQLAGTAIPVVALVQTLAEFATSYGEHLLFHINYRFHIDEQDFIRWIFTSVRHRYIGINNVGCLGRVHRLNSLVLLTWYKSHFCIATKTPIGLTVEALQFAPHLKNVLSRVLPVLGGVKDIHKKIFAEGECQQQMEYSRKSCVGGFMLIFSWYREGPLEFWKKMLIAENSHYLSSSQLLIMWHDSAAFTCWCEAMTQFYEVCPSTSTPDVDMQYVINFCVLLWSLVNFKGLWKPRAQELTVTSSRSYLNCTDYVTLNDHIARPVLVQIDAAFSIWAFLGFLDHVSCQWGGLERCLSMSLLELSCFWLRTQSW